MTRGLNLNPAAKEEEQAAAIEADARRAAAEEADFHLRAAADPPLDETPAIPPAVPSAHLAAPRAADASIIDTELSAPGSEKGAPDV